MRLKKTVGRLATYLQGYGDLLVRTNGWDPAVLERFRADEVVSTFRAPSTRVGTTEQLEHVATLLPDEWLAPAATGSPEQCVAACAPVRPRGRGGDHARRHADRARAGRQRLRREATEPWRALVFTSITSLDLYVNDEQGDFEWAAADVEVHGFVNDLERPIGTYLFGRRLYETMAVWETLHSSSRREMQDYAVTVAGGRQGRLFDEPARDHDAADEPRAGLRSRYAVVAVPLEAADRDVPSAVPPSRRGPPRPVSSTTCTSS